MIEVYILDVVTQLIDWCHSFEEKRHIDTANLSFLPGSWSNWMHSAVISTPSDKKYIKYLKDHIVVFISHFAEGNVHMAQLPPWLALQTGRALEHSVIVSATATFDMLNVRSVMEHDSRSYLKFDSYHCTVWIVFMCLQVGHA